LTLSPNCAPRSPDDLKARLTSLESILSGRTKANNRYEIDKPDEAVAWNSLALAWLKVNEGEHAGQCFSRAAGQNPLMIYRINKALAIRYEDPKDKEPEDQWAVRVDGTCARELIAEVMRFDAEKESEATKARYRDIMLVGVALGFSASAGGFDYPSSLG